MANDVPQIYPFPVPRTGGIAGIISWAMEVVRSLGASYQQLAMAINRRAVVTSNRTTNGVDSTDDLIVDDAAKGLVLKDTQGTPHYWRVTVSTLGVLTTADLGTTKP